MMVVANAIMAAGLQNQYIQPGDTRVIAATKVTPVPLAGLETYEPAKGSRRARNEDAYSVKFELK